MPKKAKIKIKELKPRIKEIKNEEETLEGDIEQADEDIFQGLESTRGSSLEDPEVLGADVDLRRVSQPTESFLGRQTQAANAMASESLSSEQLYAVGRNLGTTDRKSYVTNATTAGRPSLGRADVGRDFAMSQASSSSYPEESLDSTRARLGHRDIEQSQSPGADIDSQSARKKEYWV